MDDTALIPLQYALDTFYLLMCGALVMWMAAGFAMLESGLVRAKNTTEILTKNIVLYALACVMYLLVGYQLMYGGAPGGVLPSLGFGIGVEHAPARVAAGGEGAPYYAKRADFFFQVVFAATCMSIVSGAVAERMRLWAFLAFAVVMCALIYPVQGYWSWGGGFLKQAGFKDFAGSAVVHLAGATAALVGVLLLGPRKGKYGPKGQISAFPGANLPLATLGTLILWFGWFGFNGGSQLKISSIEDANGVAAVFVNTNLSAAGGLLAALVLARLLFGKADLTMILNGALAGLVAITAEPATPTPLAALAIGALGGVLVVFSILLLDKLHLDDPVGAISVHGVAGTWGVLAVPLTNADARLGSQLLGLGCIFVWVFLASLVSWGLIKLLMGLRVSEEEEYQGVDITECGMEAYPEFTKG
ncbi:MAG: ammonium transporter [Pseudomonas sp.]|uniref:ammonium transporter n=1 Tax=Pseudomonas sp. TaxID=306 RepID=UPI0033966B35